MKLRRRSANNLDKSSRNFSMILLASLRQSLKAILSSNSRLKISKPNLIWGTTRMRSSSHSLTLSMMLIMPNLSTNLKRLKQTLTSSLIRFLEWSWGLTCKLKSNKLKTSTFNVRFFQEISKKNVKKSSLNLHKRSRIRKGSLQTLRETFQRCSPLKTPRSKRKIVRLWSSKIIIKNWTVKTKSFKKKS